MNKRASLSRRRFIGGIAAAATVGAASSLLQACAPAAPAPEPTKPAAAAPAKPAEPTKAPEPAKPTEAPKPAAAATPTPAAAAKPAAKQTQFTYQARIGVQAEHFDHFGKLFMEKYPHIKYVPQHIPGTEWRQKVMVQAAAGTLPDAIWMMSIGLFGQLAKKGTFIDHGPLVKAHNFDLKVFYQAAVDGMTVEGKLYSIPWIVHPSRAGLYYNKPLFDAAGVKYPDEKWTYEDLTAAALALTKRSGGKVEQYGYMGCHDMWCHIIPIRAYGGDYLSPDGKKVTIDTPEATKAIQEAIADPISKHKVSPTPDMVEGGTPQMFASKKLAMFQSGYWGASQLYQYAKDIPWGVAPMPKQKNGKLGMFEIDGNSVTKSAKDPEAAFLYCAFVSSKEAGIDIAQRGSVPGGRPDVWESKELSEKPHHVVFTKIIAECPGLLLPANYRENEFSTTYQKGFDPIVFGKETDAAKVIKEMTPVLQEILDKPVD